jgi:hypothetical protein
MLRSGSLSAVITDPPLLVAAIACLFLGHVLKAARWGLFVTPFQVVRKAHLFRALAIGYALNVVLPFRLGELARAWAITRLSRLPFSQSLATIVLDRMCDLLVAIALIGLLVGCGRLDVPLTWPLAIGALTLAVLLLAAGNHWLLKRTCLALASPFNEKVRRWLLMSCWSFFTAVRMLARRRTAGQFILYTIAMWAAYLCAFLLVSRALFADQPDGFASRLADHYLPGNLHRSVLDMPVGPGELLYLAFLVAPLALIMVYGWIQGRLYRAIPLVHESITRTFQRMFSPQEHVRLLPFLDAGDQHLYLESFFASFDSRAVLTLLEQNQDIAVVRNVSGGSNATTMLALHQDRLIYRKYAIGAEADRLRLQHAWIAANAGRVPLTPLLACKDVPGYFSYDMPHAAEAYDLFTHIHSHDAERSWILLRQLLDTLAEQLHRPSIRPCDPHRIAAYLHDKYQANLLLTLQAPRCADLAAPEELLINSQPCRNLRWFADRFDAGDAARMLAGDRTCTVHGDLTVENIIVDPLSLAGYYLIDPNPANVFDSEMIDFAKLRQSLHFGYEFLCRESLCRIQGRTVLFRHAISQSYQELCVRFDAYLLGRFGHEGLRSVCFHELVHYARMMPYKIRQGPTPARIFYAALVVLHNRFHDRFHAD